MNLLLLTEADAAGSNSFAVRGRRAEHIKCVLRASPGDTLRAGMLGGNLGTATLVSVERGCVELVCEKFDEQPPAQLDIVPVISLPRPQSFKKTLHFIASSGIASAWFIMSAGVEKSYWKSSALEPGAVEEELILGLEQGGGTILPKLEFRRSFREFVTGGELAKISENCEKFVAHPYKTARMCPHGHSGKTFLAVGPESGYDESEVDCFIGENFTPVTLGRHILRVEFALAFLCGRLAF